MPANKPDGLIAVGWYRELRADRLRAIRYLQIYYCFEGDCRAKGIRCADALMIDIDLDARLTPRIINVSKVNGGRCGALASRLEYATSAWLDKLTFSASGLVASDLYSLLEY